MYIDIFILVLLVGSILGLAVAILFIVNVYSRLTQKIEETEKEKILLHTGITQKAESLLTEAHTNNLRIVSEANRKAAEIIQEAKDTKQTSEALLKQKLDQLVVLQEQTLQRLSSQFLKTYQDSLLSIQSQDMKELQKISSQVEEAVDKELTDFGAAIKKETLGVEEQVKEKVEAEFEKVQTEIEAYKKAEFEKVHLSLYPLLERVTQLVLGKALRLEDQETLVLASLEEAKKEMSQNAYLELRSMNSPRLRSGQGIHEARSATIQTHNS